MQQQHKIKTQLCKACGEPCRNGLMWCSTFCWREEDGGWGYDLDNDEWDERYYDERY